MDDFATELATELAARDAELDRLHKIYTVGRKVMCNGFPGVVAQTYTGEMRGMINVRLRSGVVCVSLIELAKFDR